VEAALKAIVEPRRREILRLVTGTERTAGEIAGHFDISRPAVSQHLKVLEDAGLVDVRRSGTRRIYRARPEGLAELRSYLDEFWGTGLAKVSPPTSHQPQQGAIDMANPVIHFEISGSDAAGLQKFYGELFEWNVDANNPMNYGMVAASEGGIGGGIGGTQDGNPQVTFYVGVDDLQAALDRAVALGGSVAVPPMDIPDGPSIAQFADPAGNRVGLVKGM
jgi:predicted enzyme related to lactoylglutathione lyase/DNA-binding transcriptional ArsR family regulator